MWVVLAADESAALPGWSSLAQLGLAGLVIAALGTFALQAWKRETARGDALYTENQTLHRENRDLQMSMQDKAIPALVTAVAAITQCTELMRELQHDREREREYQRRRDGDPR